MQLFYLDAAAEILEWPLTMLRKATIPLLERECYSRPWFLAALVSLTEACCQRTLSIDIHIIVRVRIDGYAEVVASVHHELRNEFLCEDLVQVLKSTLPRDCKKGRIKAAECCPAGVCPARSDAVSAAEPVCHGHGALRRDLACGAGCMGDLQGQ